MRCESCWKLEILKIWKIIFQGYEDARWWRRRMSFKRSERRRKGRPGEERLTPHTSSHSRLENSLNLLSYINNPTPECSAHIRTYEDTSLLFPHNNWSQIYGQLVFDLCRLWLNLAGSSDMKSWISCSQIQPCWTTWTSSIRMTPLGNSSFTTRYAILVSILVPERQLGHHQVAEAIWSPFGHGTCVHLYKRTSA